MDAIEKEIRELKYRLRKHVLQPKPKPKLISETELSEEVVRARADRAVEQAIDREREAIRRKREEWARLTTEQRRYARMGQELREREADPVLRGQDRLDAWMETKLRIERHERWLKRRGIVVDSYGNEIDYNPFANEALDD
jgi:hypothetical protein